MKLYKIDLNINYLVTFLNLIEIGSYTKTASSLGMTQPGVTQHIKKLQEMFQDSLLYKDKNNFILTDKGKILYDYGKKLFYNHNKFKDEMNHDQLDTGPLIISSTGSFGTFLYDFLLDYIQRNQKLNLFYKSAPNKEIEEDIINNDIKMGFMTRKPHSETIKFEKIASEKILLLIPHSLKDSSIEDILGLGLIDHPDCSDMIPEVFKTFFPNKNHFYEKLKKSGFSNQIHKILEPVAHGLGYTILPEFACLPYLKEQKVYAYKYIQSPTSDIYLVSNKKEDLTCKYEVLIQSLKKNINKLSR